MLFLGLGTGLGSAMVVNGIVEPMELGHLPYRKRTFEDYVGVAGRARLGQKKWVQTVKDVIARLIAALEPEDVVSRRRKREESEKVASWLPGGKQRQCIRGRISHLEKEPSRQALQIQGAVSKAPRKPRR